MKTIRILAVALSIVLVSAACGDSDDAGSDGADDRTERIIDLFREAGAPEDEARCVAEKLPADVSVEQIEAYVAAVFASEGPDDLGEPDTDVAIAVGVAVNECGF